MGTRTASPRGRYGERPQRDSVWRYICKNTTCWPATAHDVTTGVPQYKCRRENTSSAFSSSLTGLFEACRVNLVRVQFLSKLWRALARRLGSVWIRVLVIWHPMTHTTVASFVWAWSTHAMSLRGGLRALWAALYEEAQLSPVPLFEEEGQPSASRDSRPTVAEARRRMKSWGSQLDVANVLERDRPFARRPRTKWAAGLWWCDLSDIIRCSS